jgi:hypothetical protein
MNTNIHDNAEDIAHKVIGAAIEVHKHLGPGLLESAYESALPLSWDNSVYRPKNKNHFPSSIRVIQLMPPIASISWWPASSSSN